LVDGLTPFHPSSQAFFLRPPAHSGYTPITRKRCGIHQQSSSGKPTVLQRQVAAQNTPSQKQLSIDPMAFIE